MTGIRKAGPEDLDAVRDVIDTAFAGYVPLIGRRPAPMEADHAAAIARGEVVVAGEPLSGVAVARPDGDAWMIETVAVAPDAAGRGIGRALVEWCEAEARRRGFGMVVLYTNAKMAANLAVWPRLGYVEVARRVEDGFDRVFYEKRLE